MPRGRVGGQAGNRNTAFPSRSAAIGVWGLQETNDALRNGAWPTVLAPQVTSFHIPGNPSDVNASCTGTAQFSVSAYRIGSQRWDDAIGGEWQRATQNSDTPRTGNIWFNQNDTANVDGPSPSPWLSEIAVTDSVATSVAGDPHFTQTVLLLDGSGVTDKSPNAVQIGYGLKITNERSKFGGTSLYTNGAARYQFGPSNLFSMADFTIECWVNGATQSDYVHTVLGAFGYAGNWNGEGMWALRTRWLNSNEVVFTMRGQWSHTDVRTFYNVMDNNWHHIAVVRQSGTITIYIDGIARGNTGYVDVNTSVTEPIVVGGYGGALSNEYYYNGYIDDVRITRNVARYTTNFIPPAVSFLTTLGAGSDPHAANVVLLLSCDGLNNSVSVIDSSSPPKTGALIGAGVAVSLAEKKFGASSFEFNGLTDALYIDNFEKIKLSSSSNFTIEAWINLRSARQGACIISERYQPGQSGISYAFGISGPDSMESNGRRLFFGTFWGSWQRVVSGVDIPLDTWTHVAVTRTAADNRVRLFIGGQLVGAATLSNVTGLDNPARNFYIGRRWDSSMTYHVFDGYIDDIRITRGVARYTETFFPPAAGFPTNTTLIQDPNFSDVSLLLPMTSNLNDRSIHAATITNSNVQLTTTTTHGTVSGEAALFNGSNAYLTLPSAPRFSFDSDFTVEGWFRFSNVSVGYQGLVGAYTTTDASAWLLTLESNNRVYFYGSNSPGSWPIGIDSGFTPTINTWHHIAVVRLAGVISIYVDGIRRASQNSDVTINSGTTVEIGGYPYYPGNQRRPFYGWMHQVRVTKGVARYGQAFTPPTTEFPATQLSDAAFNNVRLLVNFDSGIEDFSSYRHSGFASSGTELSTTTSRSGRYSLTKGNAGFSGDFALSDSFTVEGWFYFGALTGRRYLLSTGTLGYGLVDIYLENGRLHYQNNGFEPQYLAGDQHVSTGIWNHIALVRDTAVSATTINCFINGAFYGSFTHSGVFGDTAIPRSFFVYAANGDFADDVRVTTDARYSTTNLPQINTQFTSRNTRYHIRLNESGDLRVNGDYYPTVAPQQQFNRKQFYRKTDGNNFSLVWSDGNWIVHPTNDGGTLVGSWRYYSDGYSWVPVQKIERNFTQPLNSTYTIDTPTFLDNDAYYRFKAESGFQTAYSSVARLTMEPLAIVFSKQPGTNPNEGVAVNGTTTFSVAATGVGRLTGTSYTSLTYQWQKRSASGITWADIVGGTSTSLTVSGVSVSDNGERYRVRVGCGALNVNFSNEAILTVT